MKSRTKTPDPRKINAQYPTKAAHRHTDTTCEANNNHPVLNRFVKISAKTPGVAMATGRARTGPAPSPPIGPNTPLQLLGFIYTPSYSSHRPARAVLLRVERASMIDPSVCPSVCLYVKPINTEAVITTNTC